METQIQEDNNYEEGIVTVDTYEEEEEDNFEPKQAQVINGKLYKPGMFLPGQSGNPGGRPKGPSMKTFAKEYLASLDDKERMEFLAGLPKEVIWRMAEGNPSEDKNVSITVPRPILGGLTQAPVHTSMIEEQTMNELQEGKTKDIGHGTGVGE